MNSICWGHGWQALRISPWWRDDNATPARNQDYLWLAVPIAGQVHARGLIGDALPHVQDMRDALEGGSTNLARLNDGQVIDHVARMLADGQLVLLRKAMTPEAALIPAQMGPMLKKEAAGAAGEASVKSVISAAYALPQRAAAPVAAAVAEAAPAGDFESVDQDRQAAVLQQAAADGVPFCEVCEKAKRERELAAQEDGA